MAMQQITLENAIQVSESAVFRELDGEAVILNLETGIYFGLNESGTRLWNLLAEHGSLRKAFESMTQEYEVPAGALESDILQLVEQLSEKGLVSVFPLNGQGRDGKTA